MGNVKMQKIDLCVIQDDDLAQVFLDMDQRPAVKTVVVIDQIVPPNSPKVSALHKALREKAEKEGLDFYYGKGMCAVLQKALLQWQLCLHYLFFPDIS